MRRYFMIHKFFVILLVLTFLFGCGKNLQQTPDSTIEAFLENIGKLNETSPTTIGQAKKLLRSLFSTEKAYEAFTTTFRNISIEKYSISEPMISGSDAKVVVSMETKGLIGITQEEEREVTFNLVQENGKWLIKDIAGILEKFEKKPTKSVEEEKEENK
jgi:hypothetical protein